MIDKIIYWISFLIFLPIWFLRVSSTKKKSYSEFKSGLIKHVHDFDRDNPEIEGSTNFYPCKHLGCNLVDVDLPDYVKKYTT